MSGFLVSDVGCGWLKLNDRYTTQHTGSPSKLSPSTEFGCAEVSAAACISKQPLRSLIKKCAKDWPQGTGVEASSPRVYPFRSISAHSTTHDALYIKRSWNVIRETTQTHLFEDIMSSYAEKRWRRGKPSCKNSKYRQAHIKAKAVRARSSRPVLEDNTPKVKVVQ